MSFTIKDGAMVAFAAGGILALAATAEIGVPALAIGAGLSLISGAIAVNRNTADKKTSGTVVSTRSSHRHATD